MGEKKGIDIKKCKYKIVVDSREKVNKHILNSFEKGFEYKVSHHDMYRGKKSKIGDPVEYYIQEKGLKVGDYTIAVQLPNKEVVNFKDKVVVERKADLNELCCNLFDKKDEEGFTRFERELIRAKEQGMKVYLVVETTDMHNKILSSKHFRYDKASKVSPASFNALLMTLCSRYNINVWYTDKANAGRLIHDLLYYEAREYLKGL